MKKLRKISDNFLTEAAHVNFKHFSQYATDEAANMLLWLRFPQLMNEMQRRGLEA